MSSLPLPVLGAALAVGLALPVLGWALLARPDAAAVAVRDNLQRGLGGPAAAGARPRGDGLARLSRRLMTWPW